MTTSLDYISLSLCVFELVIVIFTIFYLLNPLRSLSNLPIPSSSDNDSPPEDNSPKVSVVVYSTVEEEELTEFLNRISRQNYPDFEIIVVCDATLETTGILAEKYARMFPNVYITFIPPGSHNLSRRKLALTLGIKAASGDVIITTVANAHFSSDNWLSLMTSPFIRNSAIDIVLGYSHLDYREMKSPLRRYREFVTLLSDSRWIGAAICGHPFRGDGFNLGFRREMFFNAKGYANSIHLQSGDDDLFISQIATPDNTALVVNPEAFITTKWVTSTSRVWNLRKNLYDFTSRWLPRKPFILSGALSFMQWLILLSAVASAVTSIPSTSLNSPWGIVLLAVSISLWCIFAICEIMIYRRAASRLDATTLSISIPLYWLWKPIGNTIFRYAHHNTIYKNYTWQRR